MSDHADVYVFELKDILQVMLLVCSYIGDEGSLAFLDVVSIAYDDFVHLFLQDLGG